ncbi:extracellular catalytic domain type 1 short-chain-length polyhydroxyalkanoate depolymerase [Hoeflea ulvae]|uniref:PHB depolymerase family esterase n=1 Tax=Hoeflea ulvae TaxID=2983764 RepID=A0ABT3YM01_9HYPH|nr:PHB depolymerase family esterase [Hoeflea ulvae]MCY0096750.1 PHB depolymerase family esterase [Hoeflea ulvae]
MTFFNADALRQAMASARHGHFDPDRLVQETLSRHGLLPETAKGRTRTKPTAASGPGPVSAPSLRSGRSGVFSARTDAPLQDIPAGASFALHGFSCDAGSRDFRLYIPTTAGNGATALIVMLHGCNQTPEDFAAGTAMNELAETHGFIVAYPGQSRGANGQSCWNWFSRGDQNRDRGEPAIIAGLTRQICEAHAIPPQRTFIAGLSAGGAMAVIMGETYPELYAGIGVHSGLPYGAARDVASAFSAMGGKPMQAIARAPSAPTPRTIIFHGASDSVVHPVNGDLIARGAEPSGSGAQYQTWENGPSTRRQVERRVIPGADGQAHVEHWVIEGLGHAWSGGRPAGSYTDSGGPDASAALVRFFLNPDNKSL